MSPVPVNAYISTAVRMFSTTWDGQIIEALSYKGKNEFSGGVNNTTTAKFEITPDQKVEVSLHFYAVQDMTIKELTLEGVKAFKY